MSGERKTSERMLCALQGPSAAALLTGQVCQMGMVLFVIVPSEDAIPWLDL